MNKIKKILEEHHEWFLGGVALVLFGSILAMFAWGVAVLVGNFAVALSPPDPALTNIRFHIQELYELNLRGYTR